MQGSQSPYSHLPFGEDAFAAARRVVGAGVVVVVLVVVVVVVVLVLVVVEVVVLEVGTKSDLANAGERVLRRLGHLMRTASQS